MDLGDDELDKLYSDSWRAAMQARGDVVLHHHPTPQSQSKPPFARHCFKLLATTNVWKRLETFYTYLCYIPHVYTTVDDGAVHIANSIDPWLERRLVSNS